MCSFQDFCETLKTRPEFSYVENSLVVTGVETYVETYVSLARTCTCVIDSVRQSDLCVSAIVIADCVLSCMFLSFQCS